MFMKKKIKYLISAVILAAAVIFSVSAYMINLNAKDNNTGSYTEESKKFSKEDKSVFSDKYSEHTEEHNTQASDAEDYAVKKNIYLP